jgi:hypothetical protein
MVGLALHGRQVGRNAETWRSRRGPSARFSFGKVMALVVTIAFLIGIVVCGPAEHAALETETPSAAQVVASTVEAPAVIKVAGDHKAPVKKALSACTGHCAAHGVSLPVSFAPETVAFANRAVWQPQQDQRLLGDRAVLLDRPPRA